MAAPSAAPRGGPPPPPPIIIPPAAQLRQQPAGSTLKQSSLLIGPGKISLGVPFAQSIAARPIQQSPALQQALAARRQQEQQALARQAALLEQQRAAAAIARSSSVCKRSGFVNPFELAKSEAEGSSDDEDAPPRKRAKQ